MLLRQGLNQLKGLPVIASVKAVAAQAKPLFRTAIQAVRAPLVRKRAFNGLAHSDIDHLTQLWVRPAQSDPAIAEDLRQFTLSLRSEVATGVAARLHEIDIPTLVAWSADDVFFPQEDGRRLAATIPNARLEVIDGARTFSMVDQPDRLADLLSTIAVRA